MLSVFRRRGRLRLSGPLRILSRIGQEEPFDLSQKNQPRLSQSDGGSSGREEDEDSLYRMSQYSPDFYKAREEKKPDHTQFYSDKEDDFWWTTTQRLTDTLGMIMF